MRALFALLTSVMVLTAGWYFLQSPHVVAPQKSEEQVADDLERAMAEDLARLLAKPSTYLSSGSASTSAPVPAASPAKVESTPEPTSAPVVVRPTVPGRTPAVSEPARTYTMADCQYILSGMRTSASQELKDRCYQQRDEQRAADNRKASPRYRGSR